jgi:PAS domain S-box-containing protein
VRKSDITQQTASEGTIWIGIVGTFCFIISFTLIINFPGYIANPISQLTESIKAIANRNYDERLHFESKDEFGELAEAFNSMSSKLEEYENSSLARLLSEKKRIETLINRMHHPIIGLDETGIILFINKEAEEILGARAADLTGRGVKEAAAANDLLRTLTNQLNNSDQLNAPLRIYSHGKESFFTKEIIRVTSVPTGEKEEQFIGYVILLNDITQYKERDLAKTNFLATVSHELKTPISSIKMGLTLLKDERIGSINPEQQKLIDTIQGDSDRLLKITGELLNLTQLESGNIQLNLKPTAPSSIIQYALNAVQVKAAAKQLNIVVSCPETLPSVLADPDKTAWVLINFLTNAIRFSPEDSTIDVSAELIENTIEFSVRDLGKGIELRYQTQIFDRYFRAPNAGESSTGLGLSISKEFIEAQRGVIGVRSEIGKGSLFFFKLPVAA